MKAIRRHPLLLPLVTTIAWTITIAIVFLLLFTLAFSAQAQGAVQPDVPAGAWYESAVRASLERGYLDARQPTFRPADLATRAEVVKLLIEPRGGISSSLPRRSSFDDVQASAWYYAYFQEAALRRLVRGDRNCYGLRGLRACTARPPDPVNRAEAAALLVRAFALQPTGAAPEFLDNLRRLLWYHDDVQTAADRCILQGDDARPEFVRPASFINRAEIVTMIDRAARNLRYGVDCSARQSFLGIKEVVGLNAVLYEVHFTADLDRLAAEDESNYLVEGAEGTPHRVLSANLISNRTVEIRLESLRPGAPYTLTVHLRSASGRPFTDSHLFAGFTFPVLPLR